MRKVNKEYYDKILLSPDYEHRQENIILNKVKSEVGGSGSIPEYKTAEVNLRSSTLDSTIIPEYLVGDSYPALRPIHVSLDGEGRTIFDDNIYKYLNLVYKIPIDNLQVGVNYSIPDLWFRGILSMKPSESVAKYEHIYVVGRLDLPVFKLNPTYCPVDSEGVIKILDEVGISEGTLRLNIFNYGYNFVESTTKFSSSIDRLLLRGEVIYNTISVDHPYKFIFKSFDKETYE